MRSRVLWYRSDMQNHSREAPPRPGRPRHAAPTGDVRERILDTAEHLFASRGVSAVTLRSIGAAATVNIAAVNYYFGTKEKLFQEMFLRRVIPLNEQRLTMLKACVASGNRDNHLKGIIKAFVSPALSLVNDASPSARAIIVQYLLGRILAMPEVNEKLMEYYDTVRQDFVSALRQALPDMSERDIVWRYYWMGGCVMTSLAISPSVGTRVARDDSKCLASVVTSHALETFLFQAFCDQARITD